jgi:hypothetical protein
MRLVGQSAIERDVRDRRIRRQEQSLCQIEAGFHQVFRIGNADGAFECPRKIARAQICGSRDIFDPKARAEIGADEFFGPSDLPFCEHPMLPPRGLGASIQQCTGVFDPLPSGDLIVFE